MSPSRTPTRLRRLLGAELSTLRTLAGLSVRQLAEQVEAAERRRPDGTANHARMSRAQSGIGLIDRATVLRWLDATAADDAARERVLALLHAAHTETVKWSDALADSEVGHLQDIAAERERAAALIESYEQTYLPGLTQTAAYARALLPHFRLDMDIAGAAAARMRRQELLHESGRTFRFVVTRRALAWKPGPDVSMTAQMDRLVELDTLPGVSVRVLDDDAAVMGAMSSFNLYVGENGVLVAIELDAGEKNYSDEEGEAAETARYRERFEELYAAARPISEVHPAP